MRGPIAPPQVPLALTRAEVFDDLVRDSADRLERRWPQLADVEFAVQEVPWPNGSSEDVVPLGRLVAPSPAPAPGRAGTERAGTERAGADGAPGSAHRIVVYRRPVEIRAKSREDRAALVHEVIVEQVAELLGLSPETVDPRYGQD